MKLHTQEILEAIVVNTCRALNQIADTDESLGKMKANYIKHSTAQILKMPLGKNQFTKLNVLVSGTFEDVK